MKLTADQRIDYGLAVWGHFQHKAKVSRDATNAEYHLWAKWMDRGIPLAVVLRGIEDFKGRPRRLEVCERSVEAAIAYWHQAVGSLEDLPEPGKLQAMGASK